MRTGIQGPDSSRLANEGLKSVSVVEPVGLLRQKQDVALEEYEAETEVGSDALTRALELLSLWAWRRSRKVHEGTERSSENGVIGDKSKAYGSRKVDD